jgi:Swiss Army Knife protein, DSP-PTPase phosphatase domain
MAMPPAPPITESYWVLPGQLLAGAYPILGGTAEQAMHQRVQRFLAVGITAFVDLTEAHECVSYYPFLMAGVSEGTCPPAYQRLPIRNWDVPTPAVMRRILDAIDTAVAEGQRVYVHCAGGIGRTGTVVGCYLARHGLPGEAALAEIMRLRQAMPNGGRLSPRREPQRQMVRNWPIGR